MNRINTILAIFILPMLVLAFNPTQHKSEYHVHFNLRAMADGRIDVTLVVPALATETAIYNMPKMVPGTYKIYNFGQFVEGFRAFDKNNNELRVEQMNTNQWLIKDAKKLYKITYKASGSFQQKRSEIFAPAGTSITNDAFLLNNFGIIGYIDGYKDLVFNLHIEKPKNFYGTTSLPNISRSAEADVYRADHYFQLHDCPMLYSVPDTASAVVAGMPIKIGVYSPQKNIKASELRDALIPVFEATAAYLGDTLPASKYTIIVHGLTLAKAASGSGALEHHTSTVVTMPDVEGRMLAMFSGGDAMKMYRDVVAHEFFHIVTPLNIHARQIHDFNFINPEMSEHLWLYEGVTEYNSMIAQRRGGVMSKNDFLGEVAQKLNGGESFDQHIPFTLMSRYALSFFEDQYLNVYQQGAIIGMVLDLKLLSLSKGEYDLVHLLRDLWQTYGPDTFFVDEQLFSIMAKTSGHPEIEEFMLRHVAGTKPLPLAQMLAEFGVEYIDELEKEVLSTGELSVNLNIEKNFVSVRSINQKEPFAEQFVLQKGDIIKKWNGQQVTVDNYRAIITNYAKTAVPGEKTVIEVEREVKGKPKTVKLTGVNTTKTTVIKNSVKLMENPTPEQLRMQKAWLGE